MPATGSPPPRRARRSRSCVTRTPSTRSAVPANASRPGSARSSRAAACPTSSPATPPCSGSCSPSRCPTSTATGRRATTTCTTRWPWACRPGAPCRSPIRGSRGSFARRTPRATRWIASCRSSPTPSTRPWRPGRTCSPGASRPAPRADPEARRPGQPSATLGGMDVVAAYQELSPPLRDLLALGLQLLLIAAATIVALRLSRIGVAAIISALLDREVVEGTAQELSAIEVSKRKATLHGLATTLLRVVILAIAFLMAMQAFSLDIGPAIAGLGIIGFAVSLGSQHLVRDYLAGSFILIENQYAKGDVVRIAGVEGTVEDFSLRRTTLRDLDGTVHSVPNGQITVASNHTRVWARVNLDVAVAYDTDVERATALIDEVGADLAADPEWRDRLLERPTVVRINAL